MGRTNTKQGFMCFAQGHKAVTLMRLKTHNPSVSSPALQHWATALPDLGPNCLQRFMAIGTSKASDQGLFLSLHYSMTHATDGISFGVSKLKGRLQRLVWTYPCQNATLFNVGNLMLRLKWSCPHRRRRQSKMPILSMNIDQKLLETEFSFRLPCVATLVTNGNRKHCFYRFLICVCRLLIVFSIGNQKRQYYRGR